VAVCWLRSATRSCRGHTAEHAADRFNWLRSGFAITSPGQSAAYQALPDASHSSVGYCRRSAFRPFPTVRYSSSNASTTGSSGIHVKHAAGRRAVGSASMRWTAAHDGLPGPFASPRKISRAPAASSIRSCSHRAPSRRHSPLRGHWRSARAGSSQLPRSADVHKRNVINEPCATSDTGFTNMNRPAHRGPAGQSAGMAPLRSTCRSPKWR